MLPSRPPRVHARAVGSAFWGLLLSCGGGGAAPTQDAGSALDATGSPDARVVEPDLPDVTIETYPRVDGSTSTLPLARVIACELLGLPYRWMPNMGPEGEAEIVPVASSPEQETLAASIMARIAHNRTHQAYLNLVDGRSDLILVANPPSPDEAAYAASRGVALDLRPVALDALVIVVNASNPITGLTSAEIRGIFMGDVTRWSEVGGGDGAISPYVRPANSGSQQLMEAIVMAGLTMPAWPPDRTLGYMGELIDRIKTDPLAIGYSVYYFVTYQYFSAGYRPLAVDGVFPTAASIEERSYPYAAPVWMIVRADLDPQGLAAELRDWLLTPDGQEVVRRSGYVPAVR
jgi:phosphate transport system substrate-binding protein